MVSIYAEPYQPMSPRLPNSLVMAGMAVEMMVRSRATRNMDTKVDMMMSQKPSVLGL